MTSVAAGEVLRRLVGAIERGDEAEARHWQCAAHLIARRVPDELGRRIAKAWGHR